MPAIPSDLTAQHILLALEELDKGIEHSYGNPLRYEVVHDGKRYAPKAVVGLACRHLIGRALNHNEFSGGEAPGQANYVLRKLGFTIERKKGSTHSSKPAHPLQSPSSPQIHARVMDGIADMKCLAIRVDIPAKTASGIQREIELGLRAKDAPQVTIKLCDRRGKARIAGSSLFVEVGEDIEIFFRIQGQSNATVFLEVFQASGEQILDPVQVTEPFHVMASPDQPQSIEQKRSPEPQPAWLQALPTGAVQRFFEHLDAHDVVTEVEASLILGGPREMRRFSLEFEGYRAILPFKVKIDSVSGIKRYVNEGPKD